MPYAMDNGLVNHTNKSNITEYHYNTAEFLGNLIMDRSVCPHLVGYYAYSMYFMLSIVLHAKLLDRPFHSLFSLELSISLVLQSISASYVIPLVIWWIPGLICWVDNQCWAPLDIQVCMKTGLRFGWSEDNTKAVLATEGVTSPSDEQLKGTLVRVQEEHHAIVFLYKSEKQRYGKLIEETT